VRAAAQVFVASLDTLELAPEDAHHLGSVLRLRPGEHVVAADGAGGWRLCTVAVAPPPRGRGRPAVELKASGEITRAERPAPALTVAFALVKGDRPDWAVQKLTELGVDRIVPLLAGRGVVRPSGEAASARSARLRRVAREAAMQCRRLFLPEVAELTPLAELLATPAGGVAVADAGGVSPSLEWPTVVVGPEGGFEDGEIPPELPRVRLGPHVLRTETAAVTAGALLAALRDGLLGQP
jgi:16S rRNA (uracil1498-N3)-methyltransferase